MLYGSGVRRTFSEIYVHMFLLSRALIVLFMFTFEYLLVES